MKRGPAPEGSAPLPPLPKRRQSAPAAALLGAPGPPPRAQPGPEASARSASRSRNSLSNLALIAAAAGDDIGAYLRAVHPPIAEVEDIVALLTSDRVGLTMTDLRMLRDSGDPDFQDATLRSADVAKGAWRVRIMYAISLLPEAGATPTKPQPRRLGGSLLPPPPGAGGAAALSAGAAAAAAAGATPAALPAAAGAAAATPVLV